MKKVIVTIFLFILISCNQKKSEFSEPILIKIGYYPTFHKYAETILNLNEKYIIFYSPTSHGIAEPPPPPNEKGIINNEDKNEYEVYINERPKLNPLKFELTDDEIKEIRKLSNLLESEDFSDRKNITPAFDGMSTNIIILDSNGKLVQINPLNGPQENQRKLYSEVLNLLIKKNLDKNNSIILQKIKGYR